MTDNDRCVVCGADMVEGYGMVCGDCEERTDTKELVKHLRTESLNKDKATLEIMDLCMDAADLIESLQAENKELRGASQLVLDGLKKLSAAIDNATCDGDELRDQLATSQRRADAAVKELNRIAEFTDGEFLSYLNDVIHRNSRYEHYTQLFDLLCQVTRWEYEKEWRGPQDEKNA